jgi:hypothetical protein
MGKAEFYFLQIWSIEKYSLTNLSAKSSQTGEYYFKSWSCLFEFENLLTDGGEKGRQWAWIWSRSQVSNNEERLGRKEPFFDALASGHR